MYDCSSSTLACVFVLLLVALFAPTFAVAALFVDGGRLPTTRHPPPPCTGGAAPEEGREVVEMVGGGGTELCLCHMSAAPFP